MPKNLRKPLWRSRTLRQAAAAAARPAPGTPARCRWAPPSARPRRPAWRGPAWQQQGLSRPAGHAHQVTAFAMMHLCFFGNTTLSCAFAARSCHQLLHLSKPACQVRARKYKRCLHRSCSCLGQHFAVQFPAGAFYSRHLSVLSWSAERQQALLPTGFPCCQTAGCPQAACSCLERMVRQSQGLMTGLSAMSLLQLAGRTSDGVVSSIGALVAL